MIEIDLSHYNEMLRYESDMDAMRALVPAILSGTCLYSKTEEETKKYLFNFIGYFMHKFALDIKCHTHILPETLGNFRSSVSMMQQLLGIGEKELQEAHELQLYTTSGFWEMRRFLGQFPEFAQQALDDGVNMTVGLGMSGCVIAEYLGNEMKILKKDIPVTHMLFSRDAKGYPVEGLIPSSFSFFHNMHVLFVDDAVLTSTTLRVARSSFFQDASPSFSLFTLDHADVPSVQEELYRFVHVYEPIE